MALFKGKTKMTRQEKINCIIDYFNDYFKWQKLVNDWEIDKSKVESLSDEDLDNFITNHCK